MAQEDVHGNYFNRHGSPQIQAAEGMELPCSSPMTTQEAAPDRPDPATARAKTTRSPIEETSTKEFSVDPSSSTGPASPHVEHTQHSGPKKQQSGDRATRRRATGSHRNSSFEYKETLDATTRHLEDGSRIINQYRLHQMIGQGAYGYVYEACLLQDPSVKFAIKEFGKTRLRKTHRAANLRKPMGRGGIRTRAGFAARGRGGKSNYGQERGSTEEEENNGPETAAKELSRMSVKEAGEDTGAGKGEASSSNESNDPLNLIRHEIAILKKLDHPHVVQLYEALDDPTKDGLYLVFEHCPDGRVIDVKLHEQVTPLDEETARRYFVQIMLGIEYLHYNDIVHRDIKPDNILLQDNRKTCKIVDFGVSEMFTKPGDDVLQKSAGSPAFMSPELCTARHGDFHGKYSDIWSLGVTFYCMVVGRLPFDKSQFLELYEAITKEEPEYPSHLSEDCKHLLQRLMEKDPKKRITFAEMRKDSFVTRRGQAEVMSEEENTSTIVVEVTAEEVDGAVKKIASVFTLARAISKFKRAGSRASSTSSIGDMAGHLLQKGMELTERPEHSQKDEGKNGVDERDKNGKKDRGSEGGDASSTPTMQQLAAAHIAMGANNSATMAKDAAKAVFEKGRQMTSPRASESSPQESAQEQGPPRQATPPETEADPPQTSSYFDPKRDKQRSGTSGQPAAEEVSTLLTKPTVSSPLSDDFPNPKNAAAAYNGQQEHETQ